MPGGVYKRTKKQREALSRGAKKRWKNISPEDKEAIRAKQSAYAKKMHQDPEHQKFMRELYDSRANDDALKESLSKGIRKHFSTVKALKAHCKRQKNANRDYSFTQTDLYRRMMGCLARERHATEKKVPRKLRKRESSYGVVVENED
jgi:hypothetical protein